jgi:uncharacterized lipoprotein YmbA
MKIRTWCGAGLAALAAACGSAPKLNYYTLTAPPAPAPASLSSPLSVFVGPVSVPEGVDRPQMVLRAGPNEVAIDDFHRWAEPLKGAIPRVLADSLMRELGTQRVATTRQSASLAFDYRVAVDVQRFDSSFDEGAAIDALWTIHSAKGGEPRTGRTVAREKAPTRDAQGVAAAHSRALEMLARDIAAAIRALDSR